VLDKTLKKYKNKISGVIQVGAHIGQEVDKFLKLGDIKIYLFEPQKEALLELKKFEKYSNVYIFDFGLGNKNENVEFFKSSNKVGVASSVLKPKLHLEYFPEYEFKIKENIEIRKFSTLKEIDANFLMLDVQGYELEVLKGFNDKLDKIDYIFTEISLEELFEENTLVNDLDAFLSSKNFQRVKTSITSNVPIGDAFYINKLKLNPTMSYYYYLKSYVKTSNQFLFFNRFKDMKKIIYRIKKKLKKYI
jgi:FkbM family methyltransferase